MSDYKDIVDLLKTLSSPAKLLPKAEPLKSAMKSPLKGPSSPKSISFGIANDVSTLPKSTFMFSPEAAQPFIPSVTSNAALAPATSTFNTLATPAVSTLNPTATTFGSSFEFGKTIGAFGDSSKSPKKESSSSFESSLGSFKSSFANEEKSKVSSVPVAEPAKSVFAFGGPTDALKPAYTFGNTAAAKPLNGTEEAKPGFNFSSSEGAKPTISFGSNNSTFGSSDTTFGSSTTTFVPSSFGSSAPSGSFQFQFGAAPAPLPVSNEQGEDEGIPEGEEESFTNARANNEMIKTGKGEENETCLLEQRAKLFAVHKDEGNENLGILNMNEITNGRYWSIQDQQG